MYGFLQAFPIWADNEFLDAHVWGEGMTRKEGEDDNALRLRMLEQKFAEEGSGRRKDYEMWAKQIEGVGGAVAVEKARSDVSIDLYLTDLQGNPVTEEFAEKVKAKMWEDRRIAGHDLAVHPAPIFKLTIEAQLVTNLERKELIEPIRKRILEYAEGRSKLMYNYVGALLLVNGVEDYDSLTLNGTTDDVELPKTSILQVEVVLT